MNVQYDFTQTGGFPLDQDVLNDLQKGILLTETAVANLIGPLAIISGCGITGGSAANGVVAVNGQVLPFIGGTISAKVIIVENDTDLTYDDGTPRPSLITRYATFGDDGVQNNPWADFTSFTLPGLKNELDTDIATIGAEITAIDAILATCAKILAQGNKSIGEILTDTTVHVVFDSPLPNNTYKVLTELISETPTTPSGYDNDIIMAVRNKQTTGFDLWIGPPVTIAGPNNISVDWTIIGL